MLWVNWIQNRRCKNKLIWVKTLNDKLINKCKEYTSLGDQDIYNEKEIGEFIHI